MSIEAMKQALDALELLRYGAKNSYPINASITSLRQAIAEAEKQELVCVCGCVWEGQELVSSPPQRQPLTNPDEFKCPICYDIPRQWVGLNWDDLPEIYVGDIAFLHGAQWAEATLKEKNT